MHLEGYNAQKATFKTTINIKQIGHAVLTIPTPDKEKETFLITLPGLHIEGLVFGAPFIELEGSSYITSSSGYTAKIDYSGKGWLSGKKNSFTATLHPTEDHKEILFNATGVWTKSFDIYSGCAKTNSSSTLVESYDAATHPTTKLTVVPVEEQHPLESRRAWTKVAAAIAKGDMDAVGAEKSKIERAQRELRAKEKGEDREWERRYFTAMEKDAALESLASHVGLSTNGDSDKTGGLWRFDPAKAEKARKDPVPGKKEIERIEKEVLGQDH